MDGGKLVSESDRGIMNVFNDEERTGVQTQKTACVAFLSQETAWHVGGILGELVWQVPGSETKNM